MKQVEVQSVEGLRFGEPGSVVVSIDADDARAIKEAIAQRAMIHGECPAMLTAAIRTECRFRAILPESPPSARVARLRVLFIYRAGMARSAHTRACAKWALGAETIVVTRDARRVSEMILVGLTTNDRFGGPGSR